MSDLVDKRRQSNIQWAEEETGRATWFSSASKVSWANTRENSNKLFQDDTHYVCTGLLLPNRLPILSKRVSDSAVSVNTVTADQSDWIEKLNK